MIYHIAAMLVGFLMDLLLGDPYWLPHPIRLIGNWISFLEKRLLGSKTEENIPHRSRKKKGNAACTCSFEQYGVCDSCAFTWRIQTASLSWCCDREHYDLPDPCHEMPEGGEYESLSGTEKRDIAASRKKAGIHDRWQRHRMSG